MAHVEQIAVEDATGWLRKQFETARQRAGRVWHIVQVMSLNPEDFVRLWGGDDA